MITQRPPIDAVDPNDLELEIGEEDVVADDDANDSVAGRATSAAPPSLAASAEFARGTNDTGYIEVIEITDSDVVGADELAVASFDPGAPVEEELTDDDLLTDDADIDWSSAGAPTEPVNIWWKGLAPEIAFSLDDDDDDEPLLVEVERGDLAAYQRSTSGLAEYDANTVLPVRRDLLWSSANSPTGDVLNVLSGAESLLEKGRREDAALQVAIASRLSPLDLEIQERAKNLYLKLGMPGSAVERLIHLSIVAFESGARTRALGYAEEALSLSPDNRGIMRLVERLV